MELTEKEKQLLVLLLRHQKADELMREKQTEEVQWRERFCDDLIEKIEKS